MDQNWECKSMVSGAGLELLGSEHCLAEAKEVTEELPQEVMVLNQFLTSASVSHGVLTASQSRGKVRQAKVSVSQ